MKEDGKEKTKKYVRLAGWECGRTAIYEKSEIPTIAKVGDLLPIACPFCAIEPYHADNLIVLEIEE